MVSKVLSLSHLQHFWVRVKKMSSSGFAPPSLNWDSDNLSEAFCSLNWDSDNISEASCSLNWDSDNLFEAFRSLNWDSNNLPKAFHGFNWDPDNLPKAFCCLNWDSDNLPKAFRSLNWDSENLSETFCSFQQYCTLIFDRPYSGKTKKEVTYLLLWIGRHDHDVYDSWQWNEDPTDTSLSRYWQHSGHAYRRTSRNFGRPLICLLVLHALAPSRTLSTLSLAKYCTLFATWLLSLVQHSLSDPHHRRWMK